MKNCISVLIILFSFTAISSEAQYYRVRPRVQVRVRPQPYGRLVPPQRRATEKRPAFQPTINLSIGYGLPNLDKNQLANFYNSYKGNFSQTGPITGAVDYQFSRYMSIGLLGTYGKVSVPYYDYNSDGKTPSFTGSQENWSVMLNLMSYIPTNTKQVEPYLRTAVGINNWKQTYLDPSGAVAAQPMEPSQLAYQISLGTRINVSKQAGFFVEAGYGKYILNGGLTLKF